MIVNTNVPSLVGQSQLARSLGQLQTAIQRLSSGLRINSAKDDAAGSAISNRVTSQIQGLAMASRNANDGISLAQVAEGSLKTSGEILQRIRELSVQSANGTNSTSDRKSLNAEANQLVSELDRIARTSSFNGINLLDGSFTDVPFQVGANDKEAISISLGAATADRVGSTMVSTDFTAVSVNNPAGGVVKAANSPSVLTGPDYATSVAGFPTQTITIADTAGNSLPINIVPGDSAEDIANTINAALAPTATATATNSATIDFSGTTGIANGDTVSFKLVAGGVTTPVSFTRDTTTFPTQEAQFVNAINSASPPNLTATANAGSLTLAAVNGQNIGLEDFAVAHNSSLMTNPTVKLSFTGTSVAPVPSIAAMTLSGTSGAGDQLSFDLGFSLNNTGGGPMTLFNVSLAAGADATTNAGVIAAAINDPLTGFGPGTATAVGGVVTITSPPNEGFYIRNKAATDLSHGTTTVVATPVDAFSPNPPVFFTTGGVSQEQLGFGVNQVDFYITSALLGGAPRLVEAYLSGQNVQNPIDMAVIFGGTIYNSLWPTWTVTQSGADITLAYNGNTNISFSNGSQTVLGVTGDSSGTGFSISTTDGVNTTGNGVFNISSADVETFGAAPASGAPTSIIFGGNTVTSGSANDSAVQMGIFSINLPDGYTATSSGTMNFAGSTNIIQVSQFESVQSIDISTMAGASRALNITDGAMSMISGIQAYTGAVQNRFDSVISNLGATSVNLQSARSRIMDADYAIETAEMARAQILQQAGNSVLSKANQVPSQVLELLKN